MGYATQLAAAQTARFEWERSVALLTQRQIDLTVIRVGGRSSLWTCTSNSGAECAVIVFYRAE